VARIVTVVFFNFYLFMYFILHCFICRPSDSTVSEDAGIEPRTVATSALAVRRSSHSATSHPLSATSHSHSATSHPRILLTSQRRKKYGYLLYLQCEYRQRALRNYLYSYFKDGRLGLKRKCLILVSRNLLYMNHPPTL
jgi:hypothetical protein